MIRVESTADGLGSKKPGAQTTDIIKREREGVCVVLQGITGDVKVNGTRAAVMAFFFQVHKMYKLIYLPS